ncbi:nucleotidyltransferase family protein [soil metagenome]
MSDFLAAVILAAGSSSRLGQPKQLLRLDGKTLLTRTVELARAAGCDRVIVVVGANGEAMIDELLGTPVEIVRNEAWQLGMGSSIRAGVARYFAQPPVSGGLFLMLCDQPHVSVQTLHRLHAAHIRSGRPVCVSSYGGTIGAPVLVAGSRIASLLDVPDDRGAKTIWLDNPADVEPVPCEVAVFDVDLPSDVARMRRAADNEKIGVSSFAAR